MGQPSIRTTSEAEAMLRVKGFAQASRKDTPRRLVLAGMIGVLLLGIFFMSGTFTAINLIDDSAVQSEIRRAEIALVVTQDPARITNEYSLGGARIVSPGAVGPDEVSVAMPADTGMVLAWTPRRFASEAFAAVAPVRLGLGALVIAIVGFIMLRLHALARDLEVRRVMAQELASRDPLTGLRNRLTFDHELRDGFASGQAKTTGLALMYLDLDGFKAVNDTYGHFAGDQLLTQVGERLIATVGPNDTVARLGGDEFAIIRRDGLRAHELSALGMMVEVALTTPFELEGVTAEIGVSIGIARAPDEADTAAELVRAADRALYRAKADGGSRFAFASDERPDDIAFVDRLEAA